MLAKNDAKTWLFHETSVNKMLILYIIQIFKKQCNRHGFECDVYFFVCHIQNQVTDVYCIVAWSYFCIKFPA